ncbi:WYL domain-containing protein [Serratia marcescens]|uniref:WYL domain-containing protein n=1 Tax=Serratia marcescens TaxID=615 RepID=UPI003F80AA71
MKDLLQMFFLLVPLVSIYVFYKCRGNFLLKFIEIVIISTLSFLCIGAVGAGDSLIALFILVCISFYMARRLYTSRKSLTIDKNESVPALKKIDYETRIRENIKSTKSIENRQFDKAIKETVNFKNKYVNDRKKINISNDRKIGEKNPAGFIISNDFRYVAFDYEDSKGENSYREVDVRSFDGLYIKAYCHRAGAMRTFRVDRIQNGLILRNTGESLSIKEWVTFLNK